MIRLNALTKKIEAKRQILPRSEQPFCGKRNNSFVKYFRSAIPNTRISQTSCELLFYFLS